MENEIEQKRKELQDDVYNSSGDNTEVCSSRDFAEHILEGFNLGVEMARKEFIEFLNKIYPNLPLEGNIRRLISDYKQSLEVKK